MGSSRRTGKERSCASGLRKGHEGRVQSLVRTGDATAVSCALALIPTRSARRAKGKGRKAAKVARVARGGRSRDSDLCLVRIPLLPTPWRWKLLSQSLHFQMPVQRLLQGILQVPIHSQFENFGLENSLLALEGTALLYRTPAIRRRSWNLWMGMQTLGTSCRMQTSKGQSKRLRLWTMVPLPRHVDR